MTVERSGRLRDVIFGRSARRGGARLARTTQLNILATDAGSVVAYPIANDAVADTIGTMDGAVFILVTQNRKGFPAINRKPLELLGRGGGIRTRDPLHPMQVRYQAALRPDSLRL